MGICQRRPPVSQILPVDADGVDADDSEQSPSIILLLPVTHKPL